MEQIKEDSLKFSQSPLCPLAADVITDGYSIYFYMYNLDYEKESLLARSACWVKNLVNAPDSFDKEWIANDHQPLLPKMFVAQDMPRDSWASEDIDIIWSKEGHIAGLFYKDELISVIPSWADGKNISGYSRYVTENNKVANKLEDVYESFLPRLLDGLAFWKQEFNLVWMDYNTAYIEDLKKRYGEIVNCYDLNKDRFPSRLLSTFEKDTNIYAFTVGMGMFSMPNAESYYEDYTTYAKCEFAICLPKDKYDEEEQVDIYASISALCALPWNQIDCVGDLHTMDMFIGQDESCILMKDEHYQEPLSLSLKKDDVQLYWIIPLTSEEIKMVKNEETKTKFIETIIKKNRKGE